MTTPQAPPVTPDYILRQQQLRQQRDPLGNPTDTYAQQQQTATQQQLAKTQQVVNTPVAASLTDPTSTQNRLDITKQAGVIANQGVQGSLATQQQRNAQIQLQQWQAQQKASFEALQKQYSTLQSQLTKQYQDQMNKNSTMYANGANSTTITVGGQTMTIPSANSQGTGTGTAGIQAGQYQFANAQDAQIASWARQAGWSEDQIPMVVAIAHAESGGDPTATHGNSNGSTDYGLMQDNTIHAGDPIIQQFPDFFSGNGWKDPVKNLTVAKAIFDDAGGQWTPWSTYENGAYKQFLSNPPRATQSTPGTTPQPTFGGTPVQVGGEVVATTTGLRANIVSFGMKYQGTPYVFAGDSLTQGVDCSGLVQQVYKQFGFQTPRTADNDSHPETWASFGDNITGTRAPVSSLQPGDLVCWQGGWRGPDLVGHVAIYLGGGQILESPDTGLTVRTRALRPDEQSRLIGVHVNLPGDPK